MPFRCAKECQGTNKTTDDREYAQDNQWYSHYRRCFINLIIVHCTRMMSCGDSRLFILFLICSRSRSRTTITTHEDAKEETEHVEGRKRNCQQANDPQEVEPEIASFLCIGQHRTENLVFTPEARKGKYAT